MALEHSFLRFFRTHNSPEFHMSIFPAFQVWLLTCHFYFSNKAGKFCFFLNHIGFTLLFIQGGSRSLKY